jgi:hypothetical protein
MSFEVYFTRFMNGAGQEFPYAYVQQAFDSCTVEKHERYAVVTLPDGEHCEMYLDDGPLVGAVMFSRPPASTMFWTGLFNLMRLAHGTVYWPGGSAVADPGVIPHLPVDFVGPPTVVHTPEEMIEAIRRS